MLNNVFALKKKKKEERKMTKKKDGLWFESNKKKKQSLENKWISTRLCILPLKERTGKYTYKKNTLTCSHRTIILRWFLNEELVLSNVRI